MERRRHPGSGVAARGAHLRYRRPLRQSFLPGPLPDGGRSTSCTRLLRAPTTRSTWMTAATSSICTTAAADMPASNPRVKLHPRRPSRSVRRGLRCRLRRQAAEPCRSCPARSWGAQAAYVPAKGKMGEKVYGPPAPGGSAAATRQANDVVCVAGCIGRPGQVLQHMSDLPPPVKVSAEGAAEQAKRAARRCGLERRAALPLP